MRIDKLLWFLRLAPSRSFAQSWVMQGHIRLNGRRIERSCTAIRPGDVLVLPIRTSTKVVEIVALPNRRGPAAEAQGCYRVLDGPPSTPLARPQTNNA